MKLVALGFCLMAAGTALAQAPPTPGKAEGIAVAPIMIEVFSDFQCPSCKIFHDHGLKALRDDYISKGKVFLVFREFPLPMHPYGRQASSLAVAAARAGKYPEVANAMFAKQAEWSASGKVEEAALSGLPAPVAQKVKLLAKDPSVAAEIDRDLKMGQAAGVNSTPTLILTNKMKRYPISATLNYNLLRRLIDDLLAK